MSSIEKIKTSSELQVLRIDAKTHDKIGNYSCISVNGNEVYLERKFFRFSVDG